MMSKKIKRFFNKEDFDFSQRNLNPYEFHKYFYIFSKAFLVLDDEPFTKKSYYIHTFLICNTMLSIFIYLLGFYGGLQTLEMISLVQGGAYVILCSETLLILLCQKINIPCYHNLLKAMREDFRFICNEGQKYRSRFMETQVATWKLCVICFFFIISASILPLCSVMFLIVYLMTSYDPENDPGRPLLFPIWFFDQNISSTPYYEFFFTYTNYTALIIGYIYCYKTQTEIVWVRQITSKADLIMYAIENLMEDIQPMSGPVQRKFYDDLLKKRFQSIIMQHHAMFRLLEDFAGVYKKLLMYEQKLGGPVICFTLYASTEKWFNEGELQPVVMIICVATICVCFIPCYMCTYLGDKIHSINDACYNIPFWNASPVVRPYLVLIMQRNLRPLPLQAPGFEDVSLKTFSGKMAAAYSMFNMLRQTNLGSTL